ncbi:MAG: HlyD family secretion protein [Gammaproteobacteria bacterium]|nr:HlyD family secretion protein [Gammaproteobacteria bacterium]
MQIIKYLTTGLFVAIAIAVGYSMYSDYVTNPWTRDGQVHAQVVQITPRVSGPIVKLPITDNQLVRAGDLLWSIDPRTYQAAVEQAEAQLAYSVAALDETRDEENRARRIRKKNPGAVSTEDLNLRINKRRAAEANIKLSQAALKSAQLDLEFTEVRAPVDGYVTNLNLRLGSQAVQNSPALALVDINSYWVFGFFRENYIADMRPGDKAVVTLMTYPEQPIAGTVDSLGWGIAQQDGSTSEDLLPTINPTFEWIRLAQRVPVRVHLNELPEGIELRVGTTASVLVLPGTADDDSLTEMQPAPRLLQ